MVAPFSMHAVKMSILLVVMANRSDVLEQKINIRKGSDKMFKTQLNCAPYVAPSNLKEINNLSQRLRSFNFFGKKFVKVTDLL